MATKEEKEAFVTGHIGSNPSEVLLVCGAAPIGVFLYHEIYSSITSGCESESNNINTRGFAFVLLETITVLIPMVVCQTEFLYPHGCRILVFELLLAIGLRMSRSYGLCYRQEKHIELRKNDKVQNLDFLTVYRSTVSFLTFIAILAVDFTVFPRSFAKTEVSGYGLMDLGAGSFCISGGLVSQYARKGSISTHKMNSILKVVFRSIPLFLMGMIRLITTKGLEYQEHVSEYGIQWNFFFTLCVVGLLSTLLRQKLAKMAGYWIIVILAYQYALTVWDVQGYIENGPRQCQGIETENLYMSKLCNFFAGNREGILGSIGYLVLHLAGEEIGDFCLWNDKVKQSKKLRGRRLFYSCMVFWLMLWASISIGIPVSRRSTNASFIFWTIAHNLTILLCTWIPFELGTENNRNHTGVPPIFAAANRHGLIVFIIANLMTGIVNISINTLQVSYGEGLLAIICYIYGVSIVALLVDFALSKTSSTKDSKKD